MITFVNNDVAFGLLTDPRSISMSDAMAIINNKGDWYEQGSYVIRPKEMLKQLPETGDGLSIANLVQLVRGELLNYQLKYVKPVLHVEDRYLRAKDLGIPKNRESLGALAFAEGLKENTYIHPSTVAHLFRPTPFSEDPSPYFSYKHFMELQMMVSVQILGHQMAEKYGYTGLKRLAFDFTLTRLPWLLTK